MPNIYIEQLQDGNFAVKEEHNPKPVAVAPTQKAAEQQAHKLFPGVKLDVERVRHTEKGGPDKWRRS